MPIAYIIDFVSIDKSMKNIDVLGIKNGSNLEFTTPDYFRIGSLRLYLNGQSLDIGNDYETFNSINPLFNYHDSITILTPPVSDDVVTVDYYKY
jgi:hypothetical protein